MSEAKKVYVVHEYYEYETGSVVKCYENKSDAEKYVRDNENKEYGGLQYEIVELEVLSEQPK